MICMFEDKLYSPGNTRWSDRPNYLPLKNSGIYVFLFFWNSKWNVPFLWKRDNFDQTFDAAISLNQKVTEIDLIHTVNSTEKRRLLMKFPEGFR